MASLANLHFALLNRTTARRPPRDGIAAVPASGGNAVAESFPPRMVSGDKYEDLNEFSLRQAAGTDPVIRREVAHLAARASAKLPRDG
jgi:hypothetical protein